MRVNQFEDAAGVGKIAGKGQENDPRYKTSLTVDVHPDTVAKEIAAFFPTKPPKTRQHHIKETDMKKINEVNPHDYDSDVDYYAALRRKPRAASDDYDPPEPAPSAEDDFYDKQARDREQHKQQVQTTYSDHEGVAPNKEKYNGIYTIKAVNKATGENELYKWKNFHHGAKKVVDIKQVESKMPGGPVELTVYYVDNHKYGMWTPWKAEESRDPDHRFSNEVDGVDARVKQMAIHHARDMEEGTGEEFELAGVGVAYELGRRAYKQGMTVRDNPYSATREARKYDEWEKGLERGKWDAIEARRLRHSVGEQGVAEGWDPDTTRLEQDVRDALENGDDYTAKQYAKMAPTPEAKKYLLNIIKQAMYIDDLGGETDWKGVAEGMEAQLPQDTLDLIDEYIAKIEPTADRNKMIQDVVDGYIHTSELEYALQEGVAEGLGKLSHEQKVKMIQDLEIQISKLEQQQGGQYGNLFPQKLKLVRKLQKLRDSLGKQGVAEESGQPTMRRVTHEKPSGNGEMVKVVTYEVLNSKGVTVKTGMSRETAASLLKHLKQQGK